MGVLQILFHIDVIIYLSVHANKFAETESLVTRMPARARDTKSVLFSFTYIF